MLPLFPDYCSSVTVQKAPDQISRFLDGIPVTTSIKKTAITLAPLGSVQQNAKRIEFMAIIENKADKPIDFSPEDFSIKDENGTLLSVATYEQMLVEQQKEYQSRKVGLALKAIGQSMNSANAGYGYESGSINYSGNYAGDPYRGTATYCGTTYDPVAAQEAQQTVNNRMARSADLLEAEQAEDLSYLNSRYLKKTTVMPGKMYGGIIAVSAPKNSKNSHSMVVEVSVLGEQHLFKYNMETIDNQQ